PIRKASRPLSHRIRYRNFDKPGLMALPPQKCLFQNGQEIRLFCFKLLSPHKGPPHLITQRNQHDLGRVYVIPLTALLKEPPRAEW
ncbi:MAG TPA: hypothetical protein PL064_02125, partial [Thermogutta sp.]|nr:hypothetical protein [Thermogutta sp.]